MEEWISKAKPHEEWLEQGYEVSKTGSEQEVEFGKMDLRRRFRVGFPIYPQMADGGGERKAEAVWGVSAKPHSDRVWRGCSFRQEGAGMRKCGF